MCQLDLEAAPVWRETPRRARKPHRCSACLTVIVVGEPHLEHFSVFGDANYERLCFACWLVREEFRLAHHTSALPSTLRDRLDECVAEECRESEGGARWAELVAQLRERRRAAHP
jgi:hypothetical protein